MMRFWSMAVEADGSFAPLFRRILLALWILAIAAVVIGSLEPRLAPTDRLSLDKLVHLAAYAVLGWLPAMAFIRRGRVFAAAGAMVAMGGLIELAQDFVPGRSSGVGDFLANAIGVILGVGIAFVTRSRLTRLPAPRASRRGS